MNPLELQSFLWQRRINAWWIRRCNNRSLPWFDRTKVIRLGISVLLLLQFHELAHVLLVDTTDNLRTIPKITVQVVCFVLRVQIFGELLSLVLGIVRHVLPLEDAAICTTNRDHIPIARTEADVFNWCTVSVVMLGCRTTLHTGKATDRYATVVVTSDDNACITRTIGARILDWIILLGPETLDMPTKRTRPRRPLDVAQRSNCFVLLTRVGIPVQHLMTITRRMEPLVIHTEVHVKNTTAVSLAPSLRGEVLDVVQVNRRVECCNCKSLPIS